jgi:hypothetical protein
LQKMQEVAAWLKINRSILVAVFKGKYKRALVPECGAIGVKKWVTDQGSSTSGVSESAVLCRDPLYPALLRIHLPLYSHKLGLA